MKKSTNTKTATTKTAINPDALTYNVNHATKSIELSPTAAKAANKYGSDGYNLLRAILADFPGYEVDVKPQRKAKRDGKAVDYLKGLSYGFMEDYISNHDDEEHTARKHYEDLRAISKEAKEKNSAPKSYGEIRKWFLGRFPELVEFEQSRLDTINEAA